MVTTREARQLFEERGMVVPYGTVVRWARSGILAGAQLEDTPRGPVWMIPANAVVRFQPPTKGRPPKAAGGKSPAKRTRKSPV